MSGMEKERIRIGGLVKQSLVDWDGVLSAVVFTKGCNFRCGYCHNPALVVPALMRERPDVAESEVFDYLARRRGWLDGVVVTGGEPTLHAGLPAFLERVKALGYRVKLDTNGTNPEMLRQLIASGAVDFRGDGYQAFSGRGTLRSRDAAVAGDDGQRSALHRDSPARWHGVRAAYHASARYPYPAGTGDAAENVRRLSVCVP
ncbi:MAG: anaerobic ribonucleoside-triphosphate reductase activating protein [Alistipes inops]